MGLVITKVDAQVGAGVSVSNAVIEAKEIATRYSTQVHFKFNNVAMAVTKITNIDQLVEAYHCRRTLLETPLKANTE